MVQSLEAIVVIRYLTQKIRIVPRRGATRELKGDTEGKLQAKIQSEVKGTGAGRYRRRCK